LCLTPARGFWSEVTTEAAPPPVIPGFQIERKLGQGGMGAVYLATDGGGRRVAVKVVALAAHAELVKRFVREAQIARSLNHPDIVRVFDHGETAEHAWMSMEYLDGFELSDAMKDSSFGLDDRIGLIMRVALALDAAHEAGIVHRDVKPSNVFMTREGGVRVLDFGIARLHDSTMTTTGMVMGTPRYMAPEQTMSYPIDRRTDIFAMGVMSFEMLAGCHPWDRGGGGQLMMAMALQPPQSLSAVWPAGRFELPPERVLRLQVVLQKAIDQQPHHRYDTMRDFVVALDQFQRGVDPGVKLTSMEANPEDWGRRQIDWAQARAARLRVEGGAGPMSPAVETTLHAAPDRSNWVWIALLLGLVAIVGVAAWQILGSSEL